jgi:hypothetical protein
MGFVERLQAEKQMVDAIVHINPNFISFFNWVISRQKRCSSCSI